MSRSPTVTVDEDELTWAALAGVAEYDVLLYDEDGWCYGEPGFTRLRMAIAFAQDTIYRGDWEVKAEVRPTNPDLFEHVLVTITP